MNKQLFLSVALLVSAYHQINYTASEFYKSSSCDSVKYLLAYYIKKAEAYHQEDYDLTVRTNDEFIEKARMMAEIYNNLKCS